MSELVIVDWKLNARTVIKLYRKNTNMYDLIHFKLSLI